jgi:hypothetical protein
MRKQCHVETDSNVVQSQITRNANCSWNANDYGIWRRGRRGFLMRTCLMLLVLFSAALGAASYNRVCKNIMLL